MVDGQARKTVGKAMEILPIPSIGRPGTFLGGVGKIEAFAAAQSDVVRVGETFQYKITYKGPGAAGCIMVGGLTGLDARGLEIRNSANRSEFMPETLSRTVIYRVRATKAGSLTIPPVLVSWFDPATRRFQTTSSRAVSLRVIEVPILEASAIPVEDAGEADGRSLLRGFWVFGLFFMAAAGISTALFVKRRREVDPRRLAKSLASRFETINRADELGRAIALALTDFFHEVCRRPRGVLTPDEASRWARNLGADEDAAAAARALIIACDRACYGAESGDLDEMKDRARRLLGELGGLSKPREAPGTVA